MSERKQLISDEGVRLKPYPCTQGKITIGIGRNLQGNPLKDFEVMRLLAARPHIQVNNTPIQTVRELLLADFYKNGITREEADYLFDNDYKEAEESLRRRLPWFAKAPEEVRNILINMTFQMGISSLLTFKQTLPLIERGLYEPAADNLERSLWARQTPVRAKRVIERLRKA